MFIAIFHLQVKLVTKLNIQTTLLYITDGKFDCYRLSYVTVHAKMGLMCQKIDFEMLCSLDSPGSAISKTVTEIKICAVYPEILPI